MEQGRGAMHETQADLVETWFKDLVATNARLLQEANKLIFTPCDGDQVTPNEKIRRIELLTACVKHNVRLAARAEKLRSETYKDAPEFIEKYHAHLQASEKILREMPKTSF